MGERAAAARRPDVSPQVRDHRYQTPEARQATGRKACTGWPGGRTRLPLLHDLGARYSRPDSAARGQGHPPDGAGHRVPPRRHDRDGNRSRRKHGRVHPDRVAPTEALSKTEKERGDAGRAVSLSIGGARSGYAFLFTFERAAGERCEGASDRHRNVEPELTAYSAMVWLRLRP